MKWQTGLILLASLIFTFLLWERWSKNQLINQLMTENQRRQVDTLRLETTKNVVKYKDRIKINEIILDRWTSIHDTIIHRDTLLLECQKDIFSLDTSLYVCELALGSCLSLTNSQSTLIKTLESRKSPWIVPVFGVGLSMNRDLIVQPAINATIGINLNKIFGKK